MYLSDQSWLKEPMSEADVVRLVIVELGGVWVQTRVEGSTMLANALVAAWGAGDFTEREAETLLRYASNDLAPRPAWLP